MNVAVFPADDGGCGWYRLRHPARVLADQGYPVDVHGAEHQGQRRRRFRDGRDVLEHVEIDAEVAVFQRVIRADVVEVIAQVKAQGVRVVVDVDDDLDSLHDGHPYRAEVDGTLPGKHGRWLHEACQLADVVTCTTPALAERYGYGKAVVLPNLVPESYLSVRRPSSGRGRPLVGWTGNPNSHVGDLDVLGAGFGQVVAEAGGTVAAWGVCPIPGVTSVAAHTLDVLEVPAGARRQLQHAALKTGAYARSVSKLAVGLVPLLDTPFNRAKSWLKGIEYAALGVPFIASPLPEYRKLHDLGAGVLADGPGEWATTVEAMLGDPGLASRLAEAGREVAAGLTYEAHAGRWLDAWTGSCAVRMPDALSSSRPVEGHSSPALVES